MADNGEKKTSETNHPSENTTNDNQMTNQDQTQTGIPDDKKRKNQNPSTTDQENKNNQNMKQQNSAMPMMNQQYNKVATKTDRHMSDTSTMQNMPMDHKNSDNNHSNQAMPDMSGMNHIHKNMSGMDHMNMDEEMSGMSGMHMHMGNFKIRFWISVVLSIPILLFSKMMGMRLPFQFNFTYSEWVVLFFATILFFYGGQPFFSGAKSELKQKNPAMMTLITMGISVSYVYSIYAFIVNQFTSGHTMNFFWELATLIDIMLLGHWIEMNAVSNASGALQKIAELLPNSAHRLNGNHQEDIPLNEVKERDHLIVQAGEKMPADGKIIKGSTSVDESMVTGEARSVPKKEGNTIIGGSVNGSGTIEIAVTGTEKSGYLAQVMEMVKQAQTRKSKLESLSDKVAKWLFYVALFAGIGTFIVWFLITRNIAMTFERMVTVFVIACPHALGLAIPLVIARSTSIGARHGLLIKNRNALEQSNSINYVLLDKTGTLTEGKFTVVGLEILTNTYDEKEVLKYIGALEKNSNHPLAVGIMNDLNKQKIQSYQSENQQNISGVGISGKVNGKIVKIVNEKEIERLMFTVDLATKQKYQKQGNTISYLIIEKQLVALIALGDEIKKESKRFIQELEKQKITPVMLTGDNEIAAKNVAEQLAISEYYSNLLPEDKEKLVQKYLNEGKKVMMVGDGINDAPSLAASTIGVAIGAGTDVAIESADVVLTNSNPIDILRFFDLAKQTRKKMIQNLWWGAGYNIFAIPLATGILAPIGIVLSPMIGALFMSLSTIIVAINALTLKIHGEETNL